jgi:hypothetical protein
MTRNYEKEPIFLLERTWDDSTKLPENYKFEGTNTQNKAEVHIYSGTLIMEFFLERTRLEAGPSLSRNSRMSWAMDILPPGSRYSVNTSLNLSKMSTKLLARVKIAIRRKTSIA